MRVVEKTNFSVDFMLPSYFNSDLSGDTSPDKGWLLMQVRWREEEEAILCWPVVCNDSKRHSWGHSRHVQQEHTILHHRLYSERMFQGGPWEWGRRGNLYGQFPPISSSWVGATHPSGFHHVGGCCMVDTAACTVCVLGLCCIAWSKFESGGRRWKLWACARMRGRTQHLQSKKLLTQQVSHQGREGGRLWHSKTKEGVRVQKVRGPKGMLREA